MPHLKRLLAPPFWKVSKKERAWVVAPRPGPHPKFFSIPLSLILTQVLKIAETTTEAKKIIRKGEVFVDGKRRKEYGYPVGLFDVLSIPKLNKHYRVITNMKGLELVEIETKEANLKICKVNKKTILKKGKLQLNLHDGKNILVENGNYKTGDSLLLELPKLKIIEHLPLRQGSIGIVTRGRTAGILAKVKEIIKGTMKESSKVLCEVNGQRRIITKENFFVVGKDKPLITVG